MIVVKIELWPHGFEESKSQLGKVNIWNVGGTTTTGEYNYELFDKGGRSYKRGELKGFPRLKLLAFDLLFRVLAKAIGERNADAK